MEFSRGIRRLVFIVTAGAGLAATVAASNAQQPSIAESLTKADANGDGEVSWEEVVARREQIFAQLDRNNDNTIDRADRPALGGGRFDEAVARLQPQFDADGDGKILKSEMIDGPAPLFRKSDTNGDGVVTAEELAILEAAQTAP